MTAGPEVTQEVVQLSASTNIKETKVMEATSVINGIINLSANKQQTSYAVNKGVDITVETTVKKVESNDESAKIRDKKEKLLKKLENAVEDYINILQVAKTAPYNTNEEALQIVLKYDEWITTVAEKYGLEKAMIQAILFQEIRFYGIDDPAADSLVAQSYAYEEAMNDYTEWIKGLKWYEAWKGLLRQAPEPVLGYRTDSSTGLGQIFAKTAIEAINYNEGLDKYDKNNIEDVKEVWNLLQDDKYNIEAVALVLKYEKEVTNEYLSDRDLTESEIKEVLKSYNGSGDLAEKYKEVTFQYYKAFKEYNEVCEGTGNE